MAETKTMSLEDFRARRALKSSGKPPVAKSSSGAVPRAKKSSVPATVSSTTRARPSTADRQDRADQLRRQMQAERLKQIEASRAREAERRAAAEERRKRLNQEEQERKQNLVRTRTKVPSTATGKIPPKPKKSGLSPKSSPGVPRRVSSPSSIPRRASGASAIPVRKKAADFDVSDLLKRSDGNARSPPPQTVAPAALRDEAVVPLMQSTSDEEFVRDEAEVTHQLELELIIRHGDEDSLAEEKKTFGVPMKSLEDEEPSSREIESTMLTGTVEESSIDILSEREVIEKQALEKEERERLAKEADEKRAREEDERKEAEQRLERERAAMEAAEKRAREEEEKREAEQRIERERAAMEAAEKRAREEEEKREAEQRIERERLAKEAAEKPAREEEEAERERKEEEERIERKKRIEAIMNRTRAKPSEVGKKADVQMKTSDADETTFKSVGTAELPEEQEVEEKTSRLPHGATEVTSSDDNASDALPPEVDKEAGTPAPNSDPDEERGPMASAGVSSDLVLSRPQDYHQHVNNELQEADASSLPNALTNSAKGPKRRSLISLFKRDRERDEISPETPPFIPSSDLLPSLPSEPPPSPPPECPSSQPPSSLLPESPQSERSPSLPLELPPSLASEPPPSPTSEPPLSVRPESPPSLSPELPLSPPVESPPPLPSEPPPSPPLEPPPSPPLEPPPSPPSQLPPSPPSTAPPSVASPFSLTNVSPSAAPRSPPAASPPPVPTDHENEAVEAEEIDYGEDNKSESSSPPVPLASFPVESVSERAVNDDVESAGNESESSYEMEDPSTQPEQFILKNIEAEEKDSSGPLDVPTSPPPPLPSSLPPLDDVNSEDPAVGDDIVDMTQYTEPDSDTYVVTAFTDEEEEEEDIELLSEVPDEGIPKDTDEHAVSATFELERDEESSLVPSKEETEQKEIRTGEKRDVSHEDTEKFGSEEQKELAWSNLEDLLVAMNQIERWECSPQEQALWNIVESMESISENSLPLPLSANESGHVNESIIITEEIV